LPSAGRAPLPVQGAPGAAVICPDGRPHAATMGWPPNPGVMETAGAALVPFVLANRYSTPPGVNSQMVASTSLGPLPATVTDTLAAVANPYICPAVPPNMGASLAWLFVLSSQNTPLDALAWVPVPPDAL